MTRQQEFKAACDKITMDMIRNSMPDPKMVHADMNWNLETIGYTWDLTCYKIISGNQKKFIEQLGMETCKKSEAVYLLTVGEKTESGCFIIGKYKNYWLRINQSLTPAKADKQ